MMTREDYLYIEIKRVEAKRDYLSGLVQNGKLTKSSSEYKAMMLYEVEREALFEYLKDIFVGLV